MGTGDGLCDLAEGRIEFSGMFKAVLGHDDRVRPAAPLPHQPGSRPNFTVALGNDGPIAFELSGRCHELALSRFAEATEGKLLNAIRNGANQKIAAQPWRSAPIESAPFVAKLLRGQMDERISLL